MKDFVSNRRVSIVAGVASLLVLWAVIVVPGGPPWPGVISLSALAVLFVATSTLFLGRVAAPSMVPVVHSAEPQGKARAAMG